MKAMAGDEKKMIEKLKDVSLAITKKEAPWGGSKRRDGVDESAGRIRFSTQEQRFEVTQPGLYHWGAVARRAGPCLGVPR